MKYVKKMIGERVYLSTMNVEDAQTYVSWMNDPEVTDGIGSTSRVVSVESEQEWISKNSSYYEFAIVRIEDDQLIGNCGIESMNQKDRTAEVGIFIGNKENRGKGYGVEVLNLLLDYSFNVLNLNNVMLKVFSFNERAIKCYQKVGFQEIGRRRQAYYLNGTYHDIVYMDILQEEFYSR